MNIPILRDVINNLFQKIDLCLISAKPSPKSKKKPARNNDLAIHVHFFKYISYDTQSKISATSFSVVLIINVSALL